MEDGGEKKRWNDDEEVTPGEEDEEVEEVDEVEEEKTSKSDDSNPMRIDETKNFSKGNINHFSSSLKLN